MQAHFTTVFQSLFGGGHAKLELTDDDYLSAGVDIIVQPPGKKLQHLSLLSGGERALSAIALLFAILKVRSAPFVILDEVEAALDGSECNSIRSIFKRIIYSNSIYCYYTSKRNYGIFRPFIWCDDARVRCFKISKCQLKYNWWGYEGGTSMSFFKRLKDKFSTKSTEDIEQELSEEEGNQSSTIHDDNDEHR